MSGALTEKQVNALMDYIHAVARITAELRLNPSSYFNEQDGIKMDRRFMEIMTNDD